jgi:hypothetical protein
MEQPLRPDLCLRSGELFWRRCGNTPQPQLSELILVDRLQMIVVVGRGELRLC